MMLKRILTLSIARSANGTLSANKVISRTLSQQADFQVLGKWDLFSAVCLERHPVITKPLQDVEAKYQQMLQQIEIENSLLSDFEVQQRKEKELDKMLQSNKNYDNISFDQTSRTFDFEDSYDAEILEFQFAQRKNETEEDNALVSLKRKLDKHLVLVVKQTIGTTSLWIPPQSLRKHGETMLEAAYRTLQESCGNNVVAKFYGNAPIGHYKYKYPEGVQREQEGAKIFYFLAKYVSGDIPLDVGHSWLDRQELKDTVPSSLHKSLSQFLIPD